MVYLGKKWNYGITAKQDASILVIIMKKQCFLCQLNSISICSCVLRGGSEKCKTHREIYDTRGNDLKRKGQLVKYKEF